MPAYAAKLKCPHRSPIRSIFSSLPSTYQSFNKRMPIPKHIRNDPNDILLSSIKQYQESRRLGVDDFLNLHYAIALGHDRFRRSNLPNSCHTLKMYVVCCSPCPRDSCIT